MLRRALFLLVLALPGMATDVPVFRYALERWDPSPHGVELALAPGPLAAVQRELSALPAPMDVTVAATDAATPRITMRMPHGRVWFDGPLRPGLVAALADSAARRDLVGALVGGASLVWILVDDGSAGVDAAEARLRTRLAYLSSIMELPSPVEGAFHSERRLDLPHIPVRIDFRIQRVRRDDPAEAHFLAQLDAVGEAASAPAHVVPVFGRGRALDRLSLATLDDSSIDDICQFVLGACSCQVKDLNPGEDLLIAVDWYDRLLEGLEAHHAAEAAMESATAQPAPAAAQPETVLISAASRPAPPEPARSVPWLLIAGLLALGVCAAVVAARR